MFFVQHLLAIEVTKSLIWCLSWVHLWRSFCKKPAGICFFNVVPHVYHFIPSAQLQAASSAALNPGLTVTFLFCDRRSSAACLRTAPPGRSLLRGSPRESGSPSPSPSGRLVFIMLLVTTTFSTQRVIISLPWPDCHHRPHHYPILSVLNVQWIIFNCFVFLISFPEIFVPNTPAASFFNVFWSTEKCLLCVSIKYYSTQSFHIPKRWVIHLFVRNCQIKIFSLSSFVLYCFNWSKFLWCFFLF